MALLPRECAREGAVTLTILAARSPIAWFIDLLNANLGVVDVATAESRIKLLCDAFEADGGRVTKNLDF